MVSTTGIEVFATLENIARSDVTSISFPTHLHVLLRLREIFCDGDISFKRAEQLIHGEPLIAMRVISAANAAVFFGKPEIMDLENAIFRLGLNTTKRVTLSVAMAQLNKSKELLIYAGISRVIWLHSLYTAAAAFVIASNLTDIHPEECQTVGLMANLGAFYMLYKACENPLLTHAQEAVREAAGRHYLSMTKKVIRYIGLPDTIVEALDIAMRENTVIKVPPKDMREIIRIANVMASEHVQWDEGIGHTAKISPVFLALKSQILDRFNYLQKEYY